jgi:hypothetical protein
VSDNKYKVEVASLDGLAIAEVPAQNLTYSYVRNGPGAVSFVLPYKDFKTTSANLMPGARNVKITRNNVLTWQGTIWQVQATRDGVNVTGSGFVETLRHRIIDWTVSYVNADQFDIVWDLIDRTQSKKYGDLGIVRGSSTPSGVLRTIKYTASECKVLADAIDELASMSNGFDYELTPDNVWYVYNPFKGNNRGVTFELGKNISGLAWTLDASGVINDLTGLGTGAGDSVLKSNIADTDAEKVFGLLEGSVAFSSITHQGLLDTRTEEQLRVLEVVRDQPQMQVYTDDPSFGSYGVGDIVRLVAHEGFFEFDEFKRILSIVVSVSNEGVDNVGLEFDEVPQ